MRAESVTVTVGSCADGEGWTGLRGWAVMEAVPSGAREEADAVGLAGVEEVGEGSELGFDGGAVAGEVEVGAEDSRRSRWRGRRS